MTIQRKAALGSMIEWLADEHELGQEPCVIETREEFILHDMQYYTFRYKKNPSDPWLLGVCGGYESPDDTEHCGHVFSQMEPYDPATSVDKATAMVEMIRQYWMQRAAEIEAEREAEGGMEQETDSGRDQKSKGIFNGFVLLKEARFDLNQVKAMLLEDWGIETPAPEPDDEEYQAEANGNLVFEAEGCMVAVSYIEAPIPDGEATHFAGSNYMWKDAVQAAESHVAQLLLAVLPRSGSALDSGRLYAKLASTCLKLPQAAGLYSSGTVFQPEMFISMAELMNEDDSLPLLNLVFFGLSGMEEGIGGYTNGLRAFGKDEIEVLNSQASPADLRDFLIDIALYVVEQDVVLQPGETIGFTAEQKLPVSLSEGVFLPGSTLKISF